MAGAFVAVFGSFAALMYLSISTFSAGQNQNPPPAFFRFQQHAAAVNPSVPSPTTAGTSELSRRMVKKSTTSAWSKTVLRLGHSHSVGAIVLTYRGKEGRANLKLDVVVPDLDPQYTYRHNINIKEARKGFQVGNERFVLRSARNSMIRLLHYQPTR